MRLAGPGHDHRRHPKCVRGEAPRRRRGGPIPSAVRNGEQPSRAALYSSATRAKIGEATKARWADPAEREQMIAQLRASSADPVVRQKRVSATKERWADPSMRE